MEVGMKCDRCGIDDVTVIDLDTGATCHPEPVDCIAELLKLIDSQRVAIRDLRAYRDDINAAVEAASGHKGGNKLDSIGWLGHEVRRLRAFKDLHIKALQHVDRVFQVGGQPEPPLLPDFCRIGEDKFEAVERLAREVLRLRNLVFDLEASQEASKHGL